MVPHTNYLLSNLNMINLIERITHAIETNDNSLIAEVTVEAEELRLELTDQIEVNRVIALQGLIGALSPRIGG